MSRKDTIPSGVKYAIAKLPTHDDFTPALQLRLARQYSILHWADLGFRSLVYRRLKNITQADAENMGVVAFHKLLQVHCQIDELNRGLAFSPPTVLHSAGCLDENVCTRLWESAWWSGYAKQLLHPERDPGSHGPRLPPDWEDNPFNDDAELITTASTELTAWMEGSLATLGKTGREVCSPQVSDGEFTKWLVSQVLALPVDDGTETTVLKRVPPSIVFRAELNEFFTGELAQEGYSGCDVRVTHARTEIIIRATHIQKVLGDKGCRIRELTALVQKRLKFFTDSPELYAE
ncbi:hypothetical protein B0H13DRAFT_2523335 [Mycena leptocephala]|nr:hypothetical protein B0H13DRAFT_2335091 [Mycena leptocephala]KAJ7931845.1 hypothetical protein B0H13DRAFT_2523335 [Mycena leptocephala]